MVYVFGLGIVTEVRVARALGLDLIQPGEDQLALVRGKDTGSAQRMSVRAAGLQFEAQQLLIEWKRTLPLLELRIQRLPESARPHLHFEVSSAPTRACWGSF